MPHQTLTYGKHGILLETNLPTFARATEGAAEAARAVLDTRTARWSGR